jgi:hypothetical protein
MRSRRILGRSVGFPAFAEPDVSFQKRRATARNSQLIPVPRSHCWTLVDASVCNALITQHGRRILRSESAHANIQCDR